ncbi:uncharacterized protein LOC129615957 [Condylostylus longicornis]|uniref:uncharacterized protein LOC129615957 n=1 Tax=Condylostylus longicornis TaxID=2530218 RepID=UPI00244E572C|nr:uncharacterized protein LOC129615957 [Condylostylus longicornis]
MDKLIKLQLADKFLIEEIVSHFLDDTRESKPKAFYREALDDIGGLYAELKKRHRQILVASYTDKNADNVKYPYLENSVFNEIKTFYQHKHQMIEAEMKTKFPERPPELKMDPNQSISQRVDVPNISINLPKITLAKFDGDYQKWPSFYDLFKSLVHNNEMIPAVQKLQYLKLHLSGEPEHLLRAFQVTEDNYAAAFNMLKERYDNKRVLVNTQLKLLLNQSFVNQETATAVKKLLDTTNECLQALKNLQIDVEGWDPIIVYLIVQKLPTETHQLWEQSVSAENQLPTWRQLESFLETRFRTLEAISTRRSSSHYRPLQNEASKHRNSCALHAATDATANSNSPCPICRGPHKVKQCKRFLGLRQNKRLEAVKGRGLCINCLNSGHMMTTCPSQQSCFKCHQRHHTLLHRDNEEIGDRSLSRRQQQTAVASQVRAHYVSHDPSPPTTAGEISSLAPAFVPGSNSHVHTCGTSDAHKRQVLLATACIKIVCPATGRYQRARALIDPGSQSSFITESAVQNLKLRKNRTITNILGVSQSNIGKSLAKVDVIIRDLGDSKQVRTSALVLKKLTNLLPERNIQTKEWSHIDGLILADPSYFAMGKIDVLIGADIFGQIILEGLRKGPPGAPIAQKTIFGWIITGNVDQQSVNTTSTETFHIQSDLDDSIRRFWELEEVPEQTIYTEEELLCEKHFSETFRRLEDGRYQVELPFIPDERPISLGSSRHIAIARLFGMEKQFSKNEVLKDNYNKCIAEYLQMNHMEQVNSMELKNQRQQIISNYLPHHGVIKESSSTTKLRVVFDASRPTSNGSSLNDKTLKGPVIQDDLSTLLLRFRKYKIAFTADLEKMYRQIRIAPQHADYQRVVWRDSPSQSIRDYKLTTVTFGTKSAPFLATRVLKQLAIDEKLNYPIASRITLDSFYVDDLLSGADSIEKALEMQKQLLNMMTSGGFSLRKWSSNAAELLEALPQEHREINWPLKIEEAETVKTLGIQWDPANDQFSYKISLLENDSQKWTKRTILSEVSKLFDPLGWLAPCIIMAKIMIQKLWLSGSGWDDEVERSLHDEWQIYRKTLVHLEALRINRWFYYSTSANKIELHGFCDASIKAYAAVVYLVVIDEKGSRKTSMLIAKSKVAPIKTISLPRLELSGAALLAKLVKYVQRVLKIENISKVQAWTDSEIVLAWLRAHPSKWTTFVANRTAEIHHTLGKNIWRHVPSKENPADCASRGMHPPDLIDFKMWWNGPEWLQKSESHWPTKILLHDTDSEIRKSTLCHNTIINDKECNEIHELETRYSSFTKLINVTSYIKRFIAKVTKRNLNCNTFISVSEFNASVEMWIQIVQHKHFLQEVTQLRRKKLIHTNSRLTRLNPFLDQNGILRMGSRLRHADLNYNEKFPIILPDRSHFVRLLLEKIHRETLHGGAQLMLNVINRKFWIIGARDQIRQQIHKCVTCYRQRAAVQKQLMGDLPAFRVRASRPFTHTGVDYCGPFELRTHKGKNTRTYKAYISIFICLAVKAIHIELVTDLSSEGFIAAYRRFSSRRGRCEVLYCDNGTNLVGASKELAKQHKQMLQQLKSELAQVHEREGVVFKFIPPGSPHFGGLWEAGVRSTKQHLKKILGNAKLTYEEFSTVLTQIEACLNSRPLCEISRNPDDCTALTPGHFLTGDVIITPPEPSLLDLNENRLNRWQLLQKLHQTFWTRWNKEYLYRLQQRPKWTKRTENMKIGDLVLLRDEKLPPSRWLMGRITEIHPGPDGLVRVVTLKTKDNMLKRSIAKICLLPVDTMENYDETETQSIETD